MPRYSVLYMLGRDDHSRHWIRRWTVEDTVTGRTLCVVDQKEDADKISTALNHTNDPPVYDTQGSLGPYPLDV